MSEQQSSECALITYARNPTAYTAAEAPLGWACLRCVELDLEGPGLIIMPPYAPGVPNVEFGNRNFVGTTCPEGQRIPHV